MRSLEHFETTAELEAHKAEVHARKSVEFFDTTSCDKEVPVSQIAELLMKLVGPKATRFQHPGCWALVEVTVTPHDRPLRVFQVLAASGHSWPKTFNEDAVLKPIEAQMRAHNLDPVTRFDAFPLRPQCLIQAPTTGWFSLDDSPSGVSLRAALQNLANEDQPMFYETKEGLERVTLNMFNIGVCVHLKNMAVSYKKEVVGDKVELGDWADQYGLRDYVEDHRDDPRLKRAVRHLQAWTLGLPDNVERAYFDFFSALQNGKPTKATRKTVNEYNKYLSEPVNVKSPQPQPKSTLQQERSKETSRNLIGNKNLVKNPLIEAGTKLAERHSMDVGELSAEELDARRNAWLTALKEIERALSKDDNFPVHARPQAPRIREAYDDALFMLDKYNLFGHDSAGDIASMQKCAETGLLRGVREGLATMADLDASKCTVSFACAAARKTSSAPWRYKPVDRCGLCAVTFEPTLNAIVRKWQNGSE